jgi:hypothetical protein
MIVVSSDNQQGQIGNEIECQEENLEEAEKPVNKHVKGLAGDRKPDPLRVIDEIGGEHAECDPQDQDATVDN